MTSDNYNGRGLGRCQHPRGHSWSPDPHLAPRAASASGRAGGDAGATKAPVVLGRSARRAVKQRRQRPWRVGVGSGGAQERELEATLDEVGPAEIDHDTSTVLVNLVQEKEQSTCGFDVPPRDVLRSHGVELSHGTDGHQVELVQDREGPADS